MASTAHAPAATGVPAASHPYTCNSCQVAYRNIDLQKCHMKSDWHRYNLKRRVASLPPLSSEVFAEKVLQARAATSAQANKALFEKLCDPCNKTYYSENAYQNHLLSQRHKQSVASASRARPDNETMSVMSSTFSLGEPLSLAGDRFDTDTDADAADEFSQVIESLQRADAPLQRPSPVKWPSHPGPLQPDAIKEDAEGASTPATTTGPDPAWSLESCIFCNYTSPTVALNAAHMERFHGMFIPEKTYLVDLDGLIRHLQHRVAQGHECLACGKIKSTVFAVQTHMRDKGHCKIPFTSEAEQLRIGDFYDFRSTYSDSESGSDTDRGDDEEDAERGPNGVKLGIKRRTLLVGHDGQEVEVDGGDGDGWETDSSVSSLDSAELTAIPADGHIHQFERLSRHAHHSRHDAGHRHQVDGWHSRAHRHTHAVFHDDYELHLPSGRSVGHRSFNRFYRQNLTHYQTPGEDTEEPADEDGVPSTADGRQESADGRRRPAATGGGGRQMVTHGVRSHKPTPRGAAGMAGVTEDKRRAAVRDQRRGRDAEKQRERHNAWAYGKRANNQKTYYYRYDGGG